MISSLLCVIEIGNDFALRLEKKGEKKQSGDMEDIESPEGK